MIFQYFVYYPAAFLALVASLAVSQGFTFRPRLERLLVGLLAAVAIVKLWVDLSSGIPHDYRIFWLAGRAVLEGRDPYQYPILHPQSALPIFALFALVPLEIGAKALVMGSSLACVGLVFLSRATLAAQGESSPRELTRGQLGILALTLCLSNAENAGIALGQLHVLAAVLLIGAIWAQGINRPVLAGVMLALGTIKIGTMLPVLLLFLRRRDGLTWIVMVTIVLLLCLPVGSLTGFKNSSAQILARIDSYGAAGMVNDYSYKGPSHEMILGLDHGFYCLGMRDRTSIRNGALLGLGVLGVWILRDLLGPRPLPRGAACSLVILYSVIFLYHRYYDLVILALPLVYSVSMSRARPWERSFPWRIGAAAILLSLFFHQRLLLLIERASLRLGVTGQLIQGLILPYSTWLVLTAMLCVHLAGRGSIATEGKTRSVSASDGAVMSDAGRAIPTPELHPKHTA